jgi:hypothetical protein
MYAMKSEKVGKKLKSINFRKNGHYCFTRPMVIIPTIPEKIGSATGKYKFGSLVFGLSLVGDQDIDHRINLGWPMVDLIHNTDIPQLYA